MTFEQYLQDIHAKDYHGKDDDMLDSSDSWAVHLRFDEMVAYAEEWHAQELKFIRTKGATTTNSKYSKEQRSEWAKKGGRPRKLHNEIKSV
jgi:GTP cyclohydrolase III